MKMCKFIFGRTVLYNFREADWITVRATLGRTLMTQSPLTPSLSMTSPTTLHQPACNQRPTRTTSTTTRDTPVVPPAPSTRTPTLSSTPLSTSTRRKSWQVGETHNILLLLLLLRSLTPSGVKGSNTHNILLTYLFHCIPIGTKGLHNRPPSQLVPCQFGYFVPSLSSLLLCDSS